MLKIGYRKQAVKALAVMPAKRAAAIIAKIELLAQEPHRRDLDVKALHGQPGFRLRVGDVRVIYKIEGDTFVVDWIGPRGSAYKE